MKSVTISRTVIIEDEEETTSVTVDGVPVEIKSSPIEKQSFSGVFGNFHFGEEKNFPEFAQYPAFNELKQSWAFGFSFLEGANYRTANIALLNGSNGFWTKLDLKHFPAIGEPPEEGMDVVVIAPFVPRIADGGIRFGQQYTAEVQALKIANMISLNAGVTRSVIYERHLFWKWCGSGFIKGAANLLLESFVAEIRDSSPIAYPIVSFLLKGALDFGWTELQKKKMNWPFETAPGYVVDEFRVGLSFEF